MPNHLLSAWDGHTVPVIMRFATLYGLSPRMRFDLAINVMSARAVVEGRIPVHGGAQWRPFLHVQDAADAVMLATAGNHRIGRPAIYDCGSSDENHRMVDIGHIIATLAGATVEVEEAQDDNRDYRVDFSAIRDELGFVPTRTVRSGVQEIVDAMRSGRFRGFEDLRYSDHDLVLAAVSAREVNGVVRTQQRWPRLVFHHG
jgi:nucleoside-diphosphate-sugar epimerase